MPNPYIPPTMRGDVEPWGHCGSGDSIISCDPLEVDFNMDSLSRDRRGDVFRIRGSCRELVDTGACRIRGETGLLEELKVLKVLEILLMSAAEEALSDIPTQVRASFLMRQILRSSPFPSTSGWPAHTVSGGHFFK